MENFSGYPYLRIQFSKEGRLFFPQEVKALEALLAGGSVSDLLVLSHGWNNNMAEAKDLYKRLVTEFAQVAQAAGQGNRKFGLLGVLWPSKKFTDEELIPGSAAANLEGASKGPELADQLDNLKGFFDGRKANRLLEKAKTAARQMAAHTNDQAPEDFVRLMAQVMNEGIDSQEEGEAPEEGRPELEVVNASALLASLEHAAAQPRALIVEGGGAAVLQPAEAGIDEGGAAGLGDFFTNTLNGARNLLNFVTYYQMKERAGKAGCFGLHPVLVQIRRKFPQVKLHLVGHSFGARLLTAAIAGPDQQARLQVDTLALLQAAFSHYSLAEKYDGKRDGFFRRVVTDKKVKGPLLISFTQNDKAIGLAYAIASRIANQVAAAIGGPSDMYGGMGRNGAQKTPEAINGLKLESGSSYDFQPGSLYNLNGDSCIANHSDICHPEVARALFAAINFSR